MESIINTALEALGGGPGAILSLLLAAGWWFERKERLSLRDSNVSYLMKMLEMTKTQNQELVSAINVLGKAADVMRGEKR